MTPYTIPDQTRIGHVHLKVADLDRALAFYRDLLGFTVMTMYGTDAAFISAGGYHRSDGPASHRTEYMVQQGGTTSTYAVGRTISHGNPVPDPARFSGGAETID